MPRMPRVRTHAAKTSLCPHCGCLLEAATETGGGRGPQPGDLGICIGCGAGNMFTDDLAMRKMTAEEEARLDADQRYMIEIAKRLARERGPMPERRHDA